MRPIFDNRLDHWHIRPGAYGRKHASKVDIKVIVQRMNCEN